MMRRVLGLIVAGGDGPLDALGVGKDAALTPFAAKYRFIDFALATALNSGIDSLFVATSGASRALHAHLARAARMVTALARPFPIPVVPPPGAPVGRASRLLAALAGCRRLIQVERPEVVVALMADHILQLDLRQLLDAHEALAADVTALARPDDVAERGRFALAWTGDLVFNPDALPALLDAFPRNPGDVEERLFADLVALPSIAVYDVLENRIPGAAERPGAFWHDPTTLEDYYDAQMNLCTPRPAFDLYNPAWPLLPVASGFGPAKVVTDPAGRAGQALDSLVSDGALIQGGVVVRSVLGHGVVVESGAEVEDSVLLDGCRIGRGARVRRAVVGSGAVVDDGDEIGYVGQPRTLAHVVDSGLTVVPAGVACGVALATGAPSRDGWSSSAP